MTDKLNEKFLHALLKLNPVELAGLAMVMGIPLHEPSENSEEEPKARDGAAIINDILTTYASYNRDRRRNALKVVKNATKNK